MNDYNITKNSGCAKCGGKLRVRNTRPTDEGIIRYRVCKQCGNPVKSVESLQQPAAIGRKS